MKKKITMLLLAVLSVALMLVCTACSPDTSEIAGTYEMVSIEGTINGVNVTKENYEYYRIIIDDHGNATVQSQGKGQSSKYEAKATVEYNAPVLKLITKVGSLSAVEEMQLVDGVITYEATAQGMNFTMVLYRSDLL